MSFPKNLNATTETYYQGKRVNKHFFKENPELQKFYPSQEKINKLIRDIKSNSKDNVLYKIIIHEHSEPVTKEIFY